MVLNETYNITKEYENMSYQHILVPVDGSATSFAAIQHAASLAKAFDSQVTAILVLVNDPFINIEFIDTTHQLDTYLAQAKAHAETVLNDVKSKFNEYGVEADVKIVEGQIVQQEITQTAQNINADLIVIGSHGRKGIKKLFLGSVAQNILTESQVPVLVIKNKD